MWYTKVLDDKTCIHFLVSFSRETVNYNYLSEGLSSFNRRTLIELNHTGAGSVMPLPVDRLQVAIEYRESHILRIKV